MTRADLNATHLWAVQAQIEATDLVHRCEGDDDLRRKLAQAAVVLAEVRDLADDRLREQVVTPIRKAGGK